MTSTCSEPPTADAAAHLNLKGSYRVYTKDGGTVHDSLLPTVERTYYLNHTQQTLEYVLGKKKEYGGLNHGKMTVMEAFAKLDGIVDESDPDIQLSQLQHALQTAEAMRKSNASREFILTGLIHDMGKVLYCYGEPQWAVVGDTFPVGCKHAETIVYHNFFSENPDSTNPELNTTLGIYKENCGIDNIHMSWGHDEYMYYVVRDLLPPECLYALRYHSCYPWHTGGSYRHLMSEYDHKMLEHVLYFNKFDLYTKVDQKLDYEELKPYYENLIDEFLPGNLFW